MLVSGPLFGAPVSWVPTAAFFIEAVSGATEESHVFSPAAAVKDDGCGASDDAPGATGLTRKLST